MRILIVAAHPDDETIGASALLGANAGATVLHVTDGAPCDPRWWPSGVAELSAYARLRACEADRALRHVRAERVGPLVPDQRAVYELARIAELVAEQLVARAPDLIVTHAYEGGHPDHDAVAAAVAAAHAFAGSRASVWEMALYHGARGSLVAGEFVEADGACWILDDAERVRRDAMLACFESQDATLAPFRGLPCERYRPARAYDFARPPHDGPLWYERLGFSISGAAWRELVAAA